VPFVTNDHFGRVQSHYVADDDPLLVTAAPQVQAPPSLSLLSDQHDPTGEHVAITIEDTSLPAYHAPHNLAEVMRQLNDEKPIFRPDSQQRHSATSPDDDLLPPPPPSEPEALFHPDAHVLPDRVSLSYPQADPNDHVSVSHSDHDLRPAGIAPLQDQSDLDHPQHES
jgi:hypothetical protein